MRKKFMQFVNINLVHKENIFLIRKLITVSIMQFFYEEKQYKNGKAFFNKCNNT